MTEKVSAPSLAQTQRGGERECKRRHTLFASWIALPSARGSVKGTPNSITSEPPFSIANIKGTVSLTLGKPAVRKVTNAGSFYLIHVGRGDSVAIRKGKRDRRIERTVVSLWAKVSRRWADMIESLWKWRERAEERGCDERMTFCRESERVRRIFPSR